MDKLTYLTNWFISKIGNKIEKTINATSRAITIIIAGSRSEVMTIMSA
jgi:hypothetical protein